MTLNRVTSYSGKYVNKSVVPDTCQQRLFVFIGGIAAHDLRRCIRDFYKLDVRVRANLPGFSKPKLIFPNAGSDDNPFHFRRDGILNAVG